MRDSNIPCPMRLQRYGFWNFLNRTYLVVYPNVTVSAKYVKYVIVSDYSISVRRGLVTLPRNHMPAPMNSPFLLTTQQPTEKLV